uniref:Uridine 5'-monophosphate synthase n=1 Tax=Acrobeloides nanus TaxID=290746 RepID=A0A914D0Z9_9BILA
MLLKRKEAKSYGTKKLIEGSYEPGKKALIIEDVVTTGSSIIETVEALRNEGLVCDQVLCVIDREQGGVHKLAAKEIQLHSITSMNAILDFLIEIDFITPQKKAQILEELRAPVALNGNRAICWSLENRKLLLSKNPLNKHIIEIMMSKQTNLCVAADLTKTSEIIELVQKIHPFICALKLHIDIIEDFSWDFITSLQTLAQEHKFVLFEDRKFADTGKTMELQLNKGIYKISSWANMVTVHSVAGDATISTFREVVENQNTAMEGCLLIAELSTEGALTRDFYTKETVEFAKKYPNFVGGFICQKRCHDDPSFFYWTPGVNQEQRGDGAGQQWRSIQQAVTQDKNDIIIVGRAITSAQDVKAEAERYATAGWSSLISRSD